MQAHTRVLAGVAIACSMVLGACGDGGPAEQPSPTATPLSPEVTDGGSPSGALSGTWEGTYQSDVYSQISGTFRVEFTQSGEQITGSIEIAESPCVSRGTIAGSVSDSEVTFGAVEAEATITFTGTVAGDTMSGTFSAPDCGDDSGTWEASKTG